MSLYYIISSLPSLIMTEENGDFAGFPSLSLSHTDTLSLLLLLLLLLSSSPPLINQPSSSCREIYNFIVASMAISMPFRLHWWTPFMMVSSFFVGVLFALGHHFFYHSLVNKPTSRSDYTVMGNQLPGQQFNIAIGTTISFLVKAAFVLAASTAYYQAFWKRAKQGSRLEKSPTLARLDTTFSATTNLTSLLIATVWFRYPLLFLMAATVW